MKLRKVKQLYEKGQYDIFLLQETRSEGSEKEIKKWRKIFNTNHVYLTEQGANSVGAGIIVRNDETFRVDNVIKDPQGRYIAIIGDHEECRFLIASFYEK